jgi:hypothetical protein
VDHLVYGAPHLEDAIEHLADRTGVRARPGGRHLAYGTHNALLALGPDVYLEILAPDPRRAADVEPTIFGMAERTRPGLAGWVARVNGPADMERRIARARGAGLDLGTPQAGERATPAGGMLRWALTDPHARHFDGAVPILVDWGTTPHPARTAPAGLRLVALAASHPRAVELEAALSAIGADIAVTPAPEPGLVATLEGPKGRLTLT